MEDYKILKIHGYGDVAEAYIKVDAGDYDWLSKWSWNLSSVNGYARRTVRSKTGKHTTLYMHRLIMNTIGNNVEVDHINGDHLDNRRLNLRVCSRYENTINHHKASGVCRRLGVAEHYGKYQARIKRNGKRIYLGRFDEIQEAANAIEIYDKANNHFVYEHSDTINDRKTGSEDSRPTYSYD